MIGSPCLGNVLVSLGEALQRSPAAGNIFLKVRHRHCPFDPGSGGMVDNFDHAFANLDRGRAVKMYGKTLRQLNSPHHGESPAPSGRYVLIEQNPDEAPLTWVSPRIFTRVAA